MVRRFFKTSMIFSCMFFIASCSNFFSDFTNDDGSQKTGRDEVTHSKAGNTIVYPDSGAVTGELYNSVIDKGFVIIKNTLPGYNLIDFDDTQADYEIGADSTTTDSKVNLGIADNPVNFRCFPDDKNATVKWSIIRTAVAHLNGTTENIAPADQREEPLSFTGTERNFTTKIPYGTCIVKAVVYADDPMYNTTYTFRINKPVLADFTEDILIDLTKNTDGSDRAAVFAADSDYNKFKITQELLGDLPDYIRLEKAVYYPNYDWNARNPDGSRLPFDAPGQVKVELSDPVGKEIVLGQGKSTLAITYKDTTDGFEITKQINFNKHEVGDTKLLKQEFTDPSPILHVFSGVYKNGATAEEGEYLRGLKPVKKYSDIEFVGHETVNNVLDSLREDGNYFEFYTRADREVYFRTDSNSAASQENNFIFECKPNNDYAYISLFKEDGNHHVLSGEYTYGSDYYGLKKENVTSDFPILLHDATEDEEDIRFENIRIKTHPYAHYETATDTSLRSDIAYHRVAIRTPGKGNKQLLAYRIYSEGDTTPKLKKDAEWDTSSLTWHLPAGDGAVTLTSGSNYKKYMRLSVLAVNKANDEKIKVNATWKKDAQGGAKDIPLSVVKYNNDFYIFGYKKESDGSYTTFDDRNKRSEFNLPPGEIEVTFYVDADGDGVADDDEDKKTVVVTNVAGSSTACKAFESSDIAECTASATAANNGKTYYIVPDAGDATITVKMDNSWQVPEFYATDTNGTQDAAGHYPNLCGTPEHVEGSREWIVKMTSLPGTKDVRMLVTANDGNTKSASDVYSAPTFVSLMKEATYNNNDIGTAPKDENDTALSTAAGSPTEYEEDVLYKEFKFKAKGAYQTVDVVLNDGNTSALDVVTSNYSDYTIKLGNAASGASDVIKPGISTVMIKITSLSGVEKTYRYYIKRKSLMAQNPLSSDGSALSTDPASPTVLPAASGVNRWVTELTVVTESSTDVVTVTATHSEHNPKAVAERTAGNEWKVTVGTSDWFLSSSQGLPNGVTTVNITVTPQVGEAKTYTYYINNPNS